MSHTAYISNLECAYFFWAYFPSHFALKIIHSNNEIFNIDLLSSLY